METQEILSTVTDNLIKGLINTMDLSTIMMILGVVIFIFLIAFFRSSNEIIELEEAKYIKKGALFTVAERSFYGVLEQAISKEYKVFGKVRVADVLKPTSYLSKSDWQIAFNKISGKHFDYVLCDTHTLDVVAVIELDDKSHNSQKAKKRDDFINGACEGSGLKLIRFKALQGYQIDVIRKHIITSLGNDESENSTVNSSSEILKEESKKGLSDLDIENKPGKQPKAAEKISSSKLAKKLAMKTPEFLEKMVSSGYLILDDDKHKLTDKGKKANVEYVIKSRFGGYFLWPENFKLN